MLKPKNFELTGNQIQRTFKMNEQANKLGYAIEWNKDLAQKIDDPFN